MLYNQQPPRAQGPDVEIGGSKIKVILVVKIVRDQWDDQVQNGWSSYSVALSLDELAYSSCWLDQDLLLVSSVSSLLVSNLFLWVVLY